MIKTQFTSEAVSQGHPDKAADQISDALVDACLEQDPYSRVGIETLLVDHLVVVAGEMETSAIFDPSQVVAKTLQQLGYHDPDFGFHPEKWEIKLALRPPSPELHLSKSHEVPAATDQGVMFGFACKDTPSLLPFPHVFAHHIMQRLHEKKVEGALSYLGPDGKCLVTIDYKDNIPVHIASILVSVQHKKGTDLARLRQDIKDEILKMAPPGFVDTNTLFLINPLGTFVRGGSLADTGVTGRKIMVDTYGGFARQGGGCFSGKDPSKMDRSGAYMARYLAKNIVASNLAEICEVELAYAIGKTQPISFQINTFGTSCWSHQKLEQRIKESHDLTPESIIHFLELRKPIYSKTASGGHFGRPFPECTWEKTSPLFI